MNAQTWWPGVALGGLLVALSAYMLIRPQSQIADGRSDARDPRTVRFFGGFTLVAGTLILVINFIHLGRG